MSKFRIRKRADGHWITRVPDVEPIGPYTTRADALEAIQGLVRFYETHDKESLLQKLPIRRLKKPPLKRTL